MKTDFACISKLFVFIFLSLLAGQYNMVEIKKLESAGDGSCKLSLLGKKGMEKMMKRDYSYISSS